MARRRIASVFMKRLGPPLLQKPLTLDYVPKKQEDQSGTLRSRGRSAIYRMVRPPPYSKVLNKNSFSDSDKGSVGPIRQICQKPHVLSSSNSFLPASPGPLFAHVAGTGTDGLGTLAKNRDIMHDIDKSGFCTPLPGFLDSMSHKHEKNGLTMVVALHDKPDTDLDGDSSNCLKKDGDSRGFLTSVHEDYMDLDDNDHPNGATAVEERGRLDDCFMGNESAAADPCVIKSVQQSQQHCRGIPDYMDLDDDDHTNGATAVEERGRLEDCFMGDESAAAETVLAKISYGPVVTEKNVGINFPVVEVATSSVLSAISSTPTTNEDAGTSHSYAFCMPSIGGENTVMKESNASVTSFGFAAANVGEVSSVTGSSGAKLATSSDQKPENSSRRTKRVTFGPVTIFGDAPFQAASTGINKSPIKSVLKSKSALKSSQIFTKHIRIVKSYSAITKLIKIVRRH